MAPTASHTHALPATAEVGGLGRGSTGSITSDQAEAKMAHGAQMWPTRASTLQSSQDSRALEGSLLSKTQAESLAPECGSI